MRIFEEQKQEILKDFKERVTFMVSDMFKEHERFEPTVFFLAVKEGKLALGIMPDIGKLFINDTGKSLAVEIIKRVNQELKPIALAFAAEGWSVQKQSESVKNAEELSKEYEGERPSKHPDRREILFINFETFDKECNAGWDIVRTIIPAGELIPNKLMSTEWAIKGDRFAGKFSNLLTDNYDELKNLADDAMNNPN